MGNESVYIRGALKTRVYPEMIRLDASLSQFLNASLKYVLDNRKVFVKDVEGEVSVQ